MTATKPTLASIKATNKAAGQHFFDRDTMKFFGSVIYPTVYSGPGGTYFVDKSKDSTSQCLAIWRVRRVFNGGAEIKTNGSAHSLAEAREMAKRFAADTDRA